MTRPDVLIQIILGVLRWFYQMMTGINWRSCQILTAEAASSNRFIITEDYWQFVLTGVDTLLSG